MSGPRPVALASGPALPSDSLPTPQPAASPGTRVALVVAGYGWHRAALLAVCVIALAMGTVGLTDEGYASSDGDMARYLMNGAFIRDLAADRPLGASALFEYARLYYARYPAISLGHHPVLLSVFEAPVFAVLGLSVWSARLIPLAALLLAILYLHALVNRRYGAFAAIAAAAVFAASPMTVSFSRIVMAEMPAIALLLASAWYLQRFSDTGRTGPLVACCATFVLSLYTKPLTVLAAPGLVAAALVEVRWPRLMKRDVLLTVLIGAVAAAPAIGVPLLLSRSNVQGVMGAVRLDSRSHFLHLLSAALHPQLAWPVIAVAALAAVLAAVRRDTRAVLFVVWILSVTPALYLFGGLDEGKRYTIYWLPAFCALAGSLMEQRRLRPAIALVLTAGIALQVAQRQAVVSTYVTGMGGYEEAARFVVASNPGPTVLFSGDVDTGYFSFFVRKHDPARRLVVLRSDKIFTTSFMAMPNYEDRITRPEDIYPVLRQFGTRYVVVEDVRSKSQVLEWLRAELKSPRFAERWRVQVDSSDPRLRGTSLAVFELLDAAPPNPDAVLSLHMPLIGQSLTVPLRDLVNRKLLR